MLRHLYIVGVRIPTVMVIDRGGASSYMPVIVICARLVFIFPYFSGSPCWSYLYANSDSFQGSIPEITCITSYQLCQLIKNLPVICEKIPLKLYQLLFPAVNASTTGCVLWVSWWGVLGLVYACLGGMFMFSDIEGVIFSSRMKQTMIENTMIIC